MASGRDQCVWPVGVVMGVVTGWTLNDVNSGQCV